MNIFQVKNKVREILRRLFSEIPELRIAVLFNEDYSATQEGYSTNYMDFSTDQDQLATFIEDVSGPNIAKKFYLVLATISGDNFMFRGCPKLLL